MQLFSIRVRLQEIRSLLSSLKFYYIPGPSNILNLVVKYAMEIYLLAPGQVFNQLISDFQSSVTVTFLGLVAGFGRVPSKYIFSADVLALMR